MVLINSPKGAVGRIAPEWQQEQGSTYNKNLFASTSRLETRVKQQNKALEEIYRLSANAEKEAEALLEQVRAIGRELDTFLKETDYISVIPED